MKLQEPWRRLPCSQSQLNLAVVLKCGQSFRWSSWPGEADCWIGVLRSHLWILSQSPDHILYRVVSHPGLSDSEAETILQDYFQLEVDLVSLYSLWSSADPVFMDISQRYPGVRMLRQDPVENLFSFICSSNNNIRRISSMVEALCCKYGEKVCDFEGKDYFAFPTIHALTEDDVEAELRKMGFGYRSAYISRSARHLQLQGGRRYVEGLRSLPEEEARRELLRCSGIGPKVADCILLMSLDKPASIPVDTHMFQIAANHYLPHLRRSKTVTDKVYSQISSHFKQLFGPYAGWAHSVLFSADLRHLRSDATPAPAVETNEPTKNRRKRTYVYSMDSQEK